MCLVANEKGSNMSEEDNSHIGGQKNVFEIRTVPQNKVSHNDCHFNVLGFTVLYSFLVFLSSILLVTYRIMRLRPDLTWVKNYSG